MIKSNQISLITASNTSSLTRKLVAQTIYIANYLDYTTRGDLKMGVDNCEDKWIDEVHAPKSHFNTKFKVIETLLVGMIYRHPRSQYKVLMKSLVIT